jgi:hypothetical protein
MSEPFRDDLYFSDEIYISIEKAFEYLIDKAAVFELKNLYFYYKGFASEDAETARNHFGRGPKRVYLDALTTISAEDFRYIWRVHRGEIGSYSIILFDFFVGKINGSKSRYWFEDDGLDECSSFVLDNYYRVKLSDLFVSKAEMDEISQKYGIPKKIFRKDSFSAPSTLLVENKNSLEIGDVAIGPGESPQDLIINFIRSVLKEYPNAKTADLRRNCFEEMQGLNPRDSKIINDLLIKAGAIKSKQGEHANNIDWENKYPKAQWMRVFNKKK